MINDLKEKFNSFDQKDRFTRVKNHPLDLFIGKDELDRYALLLITKDKPKKIESSKVMHVTCRLRADGNWILMITLSDPKFTDIYLYFCNDLITSSKKTNKSDGTNFICTRYMLWQHMLKTHNQGLLTFNEVKGLIGELLFLKRCLFESIGEKNAIESWVGPLGSDQDFHYKDQWYEVKTTTPGSGTVKISSVEQLDSNENGHLIVYYIDKTSKADSNKILLNTLVDEIRSFLNEELREIFDDILLKKGYLKRDEYDEFIFRIAETESYSVGADFPCIRKQELPKSVENIKYELILATVSKYREEQIWN